jgi:hypothetical protein
MGWTEFKQWLRMPWPVIGSGVGELGRNRPSGTQVFFDLRHMAPGMARDDQQTFIARAPAEAGVLPLDPARLRTVAGHERAIDLPIVLKGVQSFRHRAKAPLRTRRFRGFAFVRAIDHNCSKASSRAGSLCGADKRWPSSIRARKRASTRRTCSTISRTDHRSSAGRVRAVSSARTDRVAISRAALCSIWACKVSVSGVAITAVIHDGSGSETKLADTGRPLGRNPIGSPFGYIERSGKLSDSTDPATGLVAGYGLCSVWEGLRSAKLYEKDHQQGGRMGTVGSGETDDTVDKLRPSLCMVQSVCD